MHVNLQNISNILKKLPDRQIINIIFSGQYNTDSIICGYRIKYVPMDNHHSLVSPTKTQSLNNETKKRKEKCVGFRRKKQNAFFSIFIKGRKYRKK